MDQTPKQPRSISEISHLFLSSVREKQTGGAVRPVRTPPKSPASPETPAPQAAPSIDLTPEEYAQVFAGSDAERSDAETSDVRIPPVTAIIAQHLNGRAVERVKDYARHLAANGERVGLLEVDGGEVRLMCFERSIEPNSGDPNPAEANEEFDGRLITESLAEMSWDLDRWLLVLPNLRSNESRQLLKLVDHWALLSTCDHDGVVSCYRTLKGLANLHTPRMTLALMETTSETQAAKVHRKLCGVCLQFLGIELQAEPVVKPTRAVAEHVVAHCRLARDPAQLAIGAQWLVVADFLSRAKAQAVEKSEVRNQKSESNPKDEMPMTETIHAAEAETIKTSTPVLSVDPQFTVRNPQMLPAPAVPVAMPVAGDAMGEVIDLPEGAGDEEAVLSAILAGARGELIECPVRAPMCPSARLAVTRDRGLVILAVARKGLTELRSIAQAYRWLVENRALIGMAVPQLSIDGLRHPRLRLLVDHADVTAEALAPMLESATVSVQAYRKLRWGSKTGLLLEAA
ncbi:MAG: hypothetical protein JWN40_4062 [Phycisphaerales bacterium]|nr:hypothetical protein [Phycisphaerales bacterium]